MTAGARAEESALRRMLLVKRAVDLVLVLPSLLLALPLLACVALAVLAFIGRPILFRQQRPGLGARPFVLIKFRTMRDLADARGEPLPDGQRLTRFGRFLRSTSLDELPELWNIVRGDMSLVGPRPLLTEYLGLYGPEQTRRHLVRPGLTGWAQINGRNAVDWDRRLALDVWYIDNWSMRLDFLIMVRTLAKVLRSEGVTQEGSATVEKFRGPAA